MTREVSSMEEMEALLAAGAAAGGTRAAPPGHEEWGSSGYLLAPEGHLWEIVWFRTE
jgi:predicted lactoylglutathione lyase